MSKSDYPDYPPQRIRKHRLVVGDATFIVSSNVDDKKRWIREVHHVRRHRKGGSAEVSIYPNGGRKPSAALASLWAYLGIDPDARWKECAADHPAFPAKRSIRTVMDAVDDARKNAAAAAVLAATGWTWVDDGAGHWEAPPAQAVDLGQFRPAVECWRWTKAVAVNSGELDTEIKRSALFEVNEADRLLALIDSQDRPNG